MKRFFKIFFIFCAIQFNNLFDSYSQSEGCINEDVVQPCCNGEVSTDPRLDQNGNPLSTNPGTSGLLNKFNWMDDGFWLYHPNGGYGFINNPAYQSNPFKLEDEYLSHLNYFHKAYIDRLPENLDFWPEDGWELIYKNNGYQNNEIDFIDILNDRLGPVFILYNKYRGILRLFSGVKGDFLSTNYILSEIEFQIPYPVNDYKYSALLSGQTNISQPLDQKTKLINISASSDAVIGGKFWSADFYMAYDPCICHNRSMLNFKFHNIDEAGLNLYGRLIGTQVTLDGSGNSPLLNGRDFLTSVYKNGIDVNAGILTYRNIDLLIEKYKSNNLGFWEKAGLDALKAAIKGGGVALDGILNSALGGPYNNFLIESGINGLLGITGKQSLGLGIFSSFADNINASIHTDSKIPNIGFIEAEMAIKGEYRNIDEINGINFTIAVPGSKETENSSYTPWHKYPMYNEALGVFTILEAPNINKHTSSWSIFDGIRNVVQYKMDLSTIKYYFNPTLDVDYDKTKISIAVFIPEFKSNYLNLPPYGSLSLKNLVESYSRNIDEGGNYQESTIHSYYGSAFYPIGCMDNILLEFV